MKTKEVHLLPVVIAVLLMLILLIVLPGCSEPAPPKAATSPPVTAASAAGAVPHGLDPAKVARGGAIYKANCVACHGARAVGAPDWQRPGADGKYPAPPLDGSGHAWHHPKAALAQTIKEGTLRLGGNMPAWKDKLSDRDVDAVIAWFQSLWPDEIYSAWLNMEMRTNK